MQPLMQFSLISAATSLFLLYLSFKRHAELISETKAIFTMPHTMPTTVDVLSPIPGPTMEARTLNLVGSRVHETETEYERNVEKGVPIKLARAVQRQFVVKRSDIISMRNGLSTHQKNDLRPSTIETVTGAKETVIQRTTRIWSNATNAKTAVARGGCASLWGACDIDNTISATPSQIWWDRAIHYNGRNNESSSPVLYLVSTASSSFNHRMRNGSLHSFFSTSVSLIIMSDECLSGSGTPATAVFDNENAVRYGFRPVGKKVNEYQVASQRWAVLLQIAANTLERAPWLSWVMMLDDDTWLDRRALSALLPSLSLTKAAYYGSSCGFFTPDVNLMRPMRRICGGGGWLFSSPAIMKAGMCSPQKCWKYSRAQHGPFKGKSYQSDKYMPVCLNLDFKIEFVPNEGFSSQHPSAYAFFLPRYTKLKEPKTPKGVCPLSLGSTKQQQEFGFLQVDKPCGFPQQHAPITFHISKASVDYDRDRQSAAMRLLGSGDPVGVLPQPKKSQAISDSDCKVLRRYIGILESSYLKLVKETVTKTKWTGSPELKW